MRGKTKAPSVPVCVSRFRPVRVFVATTFALATMAPLESRTFPAIVPAGSAANAGISNTGKVRNTHATLCRTIYYPFQANLLTQRISLRGNLYWQLGRD